MGERCKVRLNIAGVQESDKPQCTQVEGHSGLHTWTLQEFSILTHDERIGVLEQRVAKIEEHLWEKFGELP
jgi:hypothetical protein